MIIMQYGSYTFGSSNVPLPRITLSTENSRDGSENHLRTDTTVNLQGFITGPTGNNTSASGILSNVIQFHSGILAQKEPALFRVSGIGHTAMIDASGYLESLNFDTSDNYATNYVSYTMTIKLNTNRDGRTSSFDNLVGIKSSIDIEMDYDNGYIWNNTLYPIYNIKRNISAEGYRGVSGSVINAIKGINYYIRSLNINTGIFPLYNHSRSLDIDESNGSVSLTDSFISSNRGTSWLDNYNIDTSMNNDNQIQEIRINGSIQGLSKVNNFSNITGLLPLNSGGKLLLKPISSDNNQNNDRYTNALSGYFSITGAMYTRALEYNTLVRNYVGYRAQALNPRPFAITEGFDPAQGAITYNYVFNTRPGPIISGAVTESINLSYSNPLPRTTTIPILGRRIGPVVYFYTASSGAGDRTVSYEGIFAPTTGLKKFTINNSTIEAVNNYLLSFRPSAPFTGLMTRNDQSINMTENRIRQSITWQVTKCSN